MKKSDISARVRQFVKESLSPTPADRKFVSEVYQAFDKLLNQDCLQIGSYARFTSVRPLHDLDIIYVLGNWDEEQHNPIKSLDVLREKIQKNYENPTKYDLVISQQTHSVTVSFQYHNEEVFSVDIVPGYAYSKNEFGQDIYKVPEILQERHGVTRKAYYQKLSVENKEMGWVVSDPRGYVEVAKRVNSLNLDFRKATKFIKGWKRACRAKDKDFKLKSFHIEQVVTAYFVENPNLDIFDAIFRFFVNLPQIIEVAQIKDRANSEKLIDDYVNSLTRGQKENIIKARDAFMIKLEEITEDTKVDSLINISYYERVSRSEQFLFDFNIPVLLDNAYSFQIFGEVQERSGGFRKYILDKVGLITVDRKIKFRIKGNPPKVDYFKWKVKNDNSSKDPRGEITDHQTRNDPESTRYKGSHFVECYAILNNTCVAKARQYVKLEGIY